MKRLSLWITLILALASVVGAYLYVTAAIEAKENKVRKPRPAAKEQAIKMTVIDAEVGVYAPMIQASGLVKPRYSITIKNQVSGTVSQISNDFESGKIVKKGQLLAQLSNSELQSDLASAKKDLASAELALKEEKRQGDQAKAEWEASGFSEEPDSDLVLRKPQLEAVQAEYDAAKAALKKAQDDLTQTKILAPFDALIINRSISPGSYLTANSEIASLYSIDRAEIKIDLPSSDWTQLANEEALVSSSSPAIIQSVDTNASWQGKIISVGLHIDEATRMRSLTVGLDKPLEQTPILIPGTFVKVTLEGKQQDNLWRLPNTSLSQRSEIWYLDENSRLATFETTPSFVDAKYIYVPVPESLQGETVQVLVQPYNSYLEGTLVSPVKQGGKS
ncbi:efflux RND transporter periplasmic adaptor subunit [Marinomonas sp. C2222]|uniref:Efflux RND transporter periplasmic adaptor subunit n=1 Tax=Marinomonas sargassi TaxID=2984494 RepID=A0ABT2YRP5_9GAMM|nr:efflux RND transporter periplasmic adaptor subunit [Marinomonas sargassi]MCV2402562.1 efflux RND transporter periplasmic adaptor subunit [Marinomonas sargassi]